jgi:hypothetical protein
MLIVFSWSFAVRGRLARVPPILVPLLPSLSPGRLPWMQCLLFSVDCGYFPRVWTPFRILLCFFFFPCAFFFPWLPCYATFFSSSDSAVLLCVAALTLFRAARGQTHFFSCCLRVSSTHFLPVFLLVSSSRAFTFFGVGSPFFFSVPLRTTAAFSCVSFHLFSPQFLVPIVS